MVSLLNLLNDRNVKLIIDPKDGLIEVTAISNLYPHSVVIIKVTPESLVPDNDMVELQLRQSLFAIIDIAAGRGTSGTFTSTGT